MKLEPNDEYQLVAAPPSLYSAKARSCLQYKRVPYTEVPMSVDIIAHTVIPMTGTHFIPIVICPDGEVLQDSCDIVQAIEKRFPERPLNPSDPVLNTLALLFETFMDEFFAITGAYYRWGLKENVDTSTELFRIMSGYRVADKKMAVQLAASLKQKIQGIAKSVGADTPEGAQSIENAFKDFSLALNKHIETSEGFILGEIPSLADIAMMNGYFGHQWRDYSPALEFLHKECLALGINIDRLNAAAGEAANGELKVTDSLLPVLDAIGKHFGSTVGDVLHATDKGLQSLDPGSLQKRSTDWFDNSFGEAKFQRKSTYYQAWKLQRVRDAYQNIPEDRIAEADALIERTGFLSTCKFKPDWRLEKEKYFQLKVVK